MSGVVWCASGGSSSPMKHTFAVCYRRPKLWIETFREVMQEATMAASEDRLGRVCIPSFTKNYGYTNSGTLSNFSKGQ